MQRYFLIKTGQSILLLVGVLIVAAVTVFLPYSPLNQLLGFVRLPFVPVLVLLGITVLYILSSELAKRVFYARMQLST